MEYITEFLNAIISLSNAMAPYILFGLLFAGVLHEVVPQSLVTKHLGDENIISVIKSTLFGIPLPVCSCGVIPLATSIKKSGASKGATLSFLISTPITGVDSILATYGIFGWVFTLYRVVTSMIVAMISGILTNIFDKEVQTPKPAFSMSKPTSFVSVAKKKEGESCCSGSSCCESATPSKRFSLKKALRYAFITLLGDIAKPLFWGLIIGLLNFQYGVHLPGADLNKRFGPSFSAGAAFDLLTKNNWLAGIQAGFHFGDNVDENVLNSLTGADGLIFNDDIFPAEIRLRQRGLAFNAEFGRIFRSNERSRSGIRATLGLGFFQHKIRIQDDPLGKVSSLSGTYKKGYDRLSNGFATTQFIGYQYLSANRRINLMIGMEFTQAWTKNRRSFNFDQRIRQTDTRFDLLTGWRIGWTMPLYIGENPDEIRY